MNLDLWGDLAKRIAKEVSDKIYHDKCNSAEEVEKIARKVIKKFVDERIVMCYFMVDAESVRIQNESE